MIELAEGHVLPQPVGQGGNPLPVAIVPQEEGYRLPLVDYLFYFLQPREGHALPELPVAHGHQLDGLHQVVAEVAVEAVPQRPQLLVRLLGERGLQVVPYHPVPIPYYIYKEKGQEIGDEIVRPQW